MSRWNHTQCERCWFDRNFTAYSDGSAQVRMPVRVQASAEEALRRCCYCGKPTIAGIFVRDDPQKLAAADGTPCHEPDGD